MATMDLMVVPEARQGNFIVLQEVTEDWTGTGRDHARVDVGRDPAGRGLSASCLPFVLRVLQGEYDRRWGWRAQEWLKLGRKRWVVR